MWVYRSALGVPTSDEAVVGLMVRHALDGELTTFYWGQAYGGTQEVLLTVPVFLAFGESWLALRLPSMLLAALASLVVWRARAGPSDTIARPPRCVRLTRRRAG